MKIKISIITLLLLCFASCSQPSAKTYPSARNAPNQEDESKLMERDQVDLHLDRINVRGSFEYADKGNRSIQLPVGALVSVEKSVKRPKLFHVHDCNFTLIGKDVALTAGHCIPKEVALGQVACSNRVYAAFAGHEHLYACKEILYMNATFLKYDDPNAKRPAYYTPDIAIFRLSEAAPIEPVEINFAKPLNRSENYYIYAYDDIDDGFLHFQAAPLKKVNLTRNLPTGNTFAFRDLHGPKITAGHSGSGLFDANNDVRGLTAWSNGDGNFTAIDLSCMGQAGGAYYWSKSCLQIYKNSY